MEGPVAVVTGGASGIGRATVERMVAAGGRVVFGELNQDNARRLIDELGAPDGLRFVPTDVAEEDDVAALVATAMSTFGRLDVMFNNAGVGGAYGPITAIEVEDWDRTFGVLVRSVFLGTKYAARVMIEQGGGGSIVNTASVAGLTGGGGPQAYSAAKAAVINLTFSTAVELAVHRIRVNAICPGLINTPLAIRNDRDRSRVRELMSLVQPWPDLGRPEDIAALVVWL
ncbi:MAG: SDR family NAD(P)-dependent oxidoreductase, partial [Ilumatobacteraceae bacterium]